MFTCLEGQIVYYKFAMGEITVQTELTKVSYCCVILLLGGFIDNGFSGSCDMSSML